LPSLCLPFASPCFDCMDTIYLYASHHALSTLMHAVSQHT
jgi:hypothetical protein